MCRDPGTVVAGVATAAGMLASRMMPRVTALFLAITMATSLTGFLLPSVRVGPSHVADAASLVALAPAALALYVCRLDGAWRAIYAVCAIFMLWLDTAVGVLQAFRKSR